MEVKPVLGVAEAVVELVQIGQHGSDFVPGAADVGGAVANPTSLKQRLGFVKAPLVDVGVDEGAERHDFRVNEFVAEDPLEGYDEGVVDAVRDLEVVSGYVVAFAVDLAGYAKGLVVGPALGIQAVGELAAAPANPGHRRIGHGLVPGHGVGSVVRPPAPRSNVAQDAYALAHASPVEMRRRGGDDVEVQDQVLGRDGVEMELPDLLTADGDGGLEDRAGGDDGGDHDQRLAEFPGRDLANVQRVAAANGEDDFGVGQALDQGFQVVLAHAALELDRPGWMRQ